jgi:hypothetical protein
MDWTALTPERRGILAVRDRLGLLVAVWAVNAAPVAFVLHWDDNHTQHLVSRPEASYRTMAEAYSAGTIALKQRHNS